MNQNQPAPLGIENFRPAPVDDRRLKWLGILMVLIVFGGFGTWAALAPLSSAAYGPGVIAVESYRKTVQHLEGGIVKTILVRDGQAVQKDEVLITLEDTQPRAQLEVLRGQYFMTLARAARLVASSGRANWLAGFCDTADNTVGFGLCPDGKNAAARVATPTCPALSANRTRAQISCVLS